MIKNYILFSRLLSWQSAFYKIDAKYLPHIFIRVTSISRILEVAWVATIWSFSKIFLFYKYIKFLQKNSHKIFLVIIFGNFDADFFLNLYLQDFLVKQVSLIRYFFYGLFLWLYHWLVPKFLHDKNAIELHVV